MLIRLFIQISVCLRYLL